MSKGTNDDLWKKWKLFEEHDGFNAVNTWVSNFGREANTLNNQEIGKDHGNLVISFLKRATAEPRVAKKMFSSKIFEKILHLTFFGALFNDTGYHDDFTLMTLDLVTQFPEVDSSSSWPLEIAELALGRGLQIVEKNFQSETVLVKKLLLGQLFTQRNLTGVNFNGIQVTEKEMEQLFFLRSSPEGLVKSMQGGSSKIVIRPGSIQKGFNSLLLSKSNRLHLCRKPFLDYLFLTLDIFSNLPVPKSYEQTLETMCVTSLRSLFLICHSCHDFIDFLVADKEKMTS